MSKNCWQCKIGEVEHDGLPHGSDAPMRKAVREAYVALTGEEPVAIFSGWGAEFDESDRAVIEDREPNPALIGLQGNEQYRQQMVGISTAAIGYWKEGDGIHPDYDTLALRDVAKLYAKYDELYKAPTPSAAVVRDAERYRWIRRQRGYVCHYDPDTLDAAVDVGRKDTLEDWS